MDQKHFVCQIQTWLFAPGSLKIIKNGKPTPRPRQRQNFGFRVLQNTGEWPKTPPNKYASKPPSAPSTHI